MANKMTAEQMLSRIYNMTRGMVSPSNVSAEAAKKQKKAAGGKTKKAKGMATGGKRGGAKKMANGGKAMMRKSKGMKRGGKMKAKGMKRGGKAKR